MLVVTAFDLTLETKRAATPEGELKDTRECKHKQVAHLVPLRAVASRFLMTLKDYPPSRKPGDWSLDSLERQIKNMTSTGERAAIHSRATVHPGGGRCDVPRQPSSGNSYRLSPPNASPPSTWLNPIGGAGHDAGAREE